MEINTNIPILNIASLGNPASKSTTDIDDAQASLASAIAGGAGGSAAVVDVPQDVQNAVAATVKLQSVPQLIDDSVLNELTKLSLEIAPQAVGGLPAPVVATPETTSPNNTAVPPQPVPYPKADAATKAFSNTVNIKT